jgi:dethiobiotin synthetase
MLETLKGMSAYFVTATGTDIGKTYVTAGILRAARAAWRQACAIKPVMSGYNPQESASSDAAVLLEAMGRAVSAENIATISPWRFTAPLSPDMAARRENRAIDLTELTDFCTAAARAAPELLLIEGVGGAMVPLNDHQTVRDWIAALKLPVILVAGTYLGCISHTLCTAEALLGRGLEISAIVLSESRNAPVATEETALAIARFLPATRIEIIPRKFNERSFANLAAFF